MTHLLIDGYNLIRQDAELLRHERSSLEQAREVLIERLGRYKQRRGHDITVVFDAWGAEHEHLSSYRDKGVVIEFTARGLTADARIGELVLTQPHKWVVVSSDRQIADHARRRGAGVMGAVEFARHLQTTLVLGEIPIPARDDELPQPVHKRWLTKKKGPSKRLPKSARQARRRLQKL